MKQIFFLALLFVLTVQIGFTQEVIIPEAITGYDLPELPRNGNAPEGDPVWYYFESAYAIDSLQEHKPFGYQGEIKKHLQIAADALMVVGWGINHDYQADQYRGLVYLHQGNYQDALEVFLLVDTAIKSNFRGNTWSQWGTSDHFSNNANIGICYMLLEMYEEAWEYLQPLSEFPIEPHSWHGSRRGRLIADAALPYLAKVLGRKFVPGDHFMIYTDSFSIRVPIYDPGYIGGYQDYGPHLEKAFEDLMEAYGTRMHHDKSHATEKFTSARDEFNASLTDTVSGEQYMLIGITQLHLGDYKESKKSFTTALKMLGKGTVWNWHHWVCHNHLRVIASLHREKYSIPWQVTNKFLEMQGQYKVGDEYYRTRICPECPID